MFIHWNTYRDMKKSVAVTMLCRYLIEKLAPQNSCGYLTNGKFKQAQKIQQYNKWLFHDKLVVPYIVYSREQVRLLEQTWEKKCGTIMTTIQLVGVASRSV